MAELVPALVLAAGAGSRFGDEAKLLAEVGGRPLVGRVVAAALAAERVGPVVVVVGAHADAVAAAVARPGVEVVACPGWAEGQAASLRCGLRALGDVERAIVLVGDQPGLTSAAIDRIAAGPSGTRAAYAGRPGHPALLDRDLIAAGLGLRGDRGLRDVTRWGLVECGDVGSGRDVDTPADLVAVRAEAQGDGETGGR